MLVSVLLVLTASGACLGQPIPCTQVAYPSVADLHGNIHPFVFVGLKEAKTSVTLTNKCATTNGVVFQVCDDVAPGVVPEGFFNVLVIRRNAGVGTFTLTAVYYCD